MQEGLWREECWFLAAEEAAAQGHSDRAASLCGSAGRFASDCAQHLWQDDLHGLVERQRGFAADLSAAETLERRWQARIGAEDIGERFWYRYFSDGFAAQDHVDLSWCDALPEPRAAACVRAGEEWYRIELGVRLDRLAALGALCGVDQPTSASLAIWLTVRPDPRLDRVVGERREALCPPISAGEAPR